MIEHVIRRLWHATSAAEAASVLESRAAGLGMDEVAQRREVFGRNVLTRPKRAGPPAVYLRQFRSPLIYLLLGAAVVSLGIAEYSDAVFIFVALQINAVVGAFQEWKAESSAEALNAMIPDEVMVRRSAKRHLIVSADLVPGRHRPSAVRRPGARRCPPDHGGRRDRRRIHADRRIDPRGQGLGFRPRRSDRRNMLHAGTTVLAGRAAGIVTQIGLHTELGQIAQAMAGFEAGTPPLVLPSGRAIEATGEGYVPVGTLRIEGEIVDHEIGAAARRFASAGNLCNEATFRIEPGGAVHFGDTVDVGGLPGPGRETGRSALGGARALSRDRVRSVRAAPALRSQLQ